MKKVSVKGFSFLGLLLIGTSAVVAAILPKANKVAAGHIENGVAFTTDGATCVAGGSGCNVTAASAAGTTAGSLLTSADQAGSASALLNVNTTANG